MSKKPFEIDMIAGSQLRDTQGEMLSVEGCDISELEAGHGRLNDNHGKGFFNSIGRITGAKKIFKAEDCENDRHKYYWEKVKVPYIYVVGELYDNDDHPNARAAAAIIRNIHNQDNPLKCKASVEGGVIARGIGDSNLLARTKLSQVALTFTPANNATLVEPLNMQKSDSWEQDRLLIKSVMHLARTDVPSFRHITRRAQAEKISENLRKANEIAEHAGLKGKIPYFTPDELIAQALEFKITQNINKIHDLVLKSRVMDSKHPSFVPPKESRASFKPNAGSAMDIKSGKYNVDPEHSKQMLANASIPETKSNLNNAINTTDIHETQHSKNNNISKQLKNKNGNAISGDDFSRHVIHNAGLDPHERHFLEHFVPAYTNDYSVGDPDEVMSTVAESLSGRGTRRDPALKELQQKLPSETNESMLARLKDIHGKFSNTYGQYEAGQRLNIPTHDEYIDKNFPDEEFKGYKPKEVKKLNKALTAGYGGAGAPGSMSGGSVLQSEALDDGRRGFQHIKCNSCGAENIYMKHQVKCRKCGQSYPMADLYTVMVHAK